MMRTFRWMLPVLASALFAAGCVAIGGKAETHAPTTGQQLVDLKLALDQGAITQEEYDQAKTRLLAELGNRGRR